MTRFSRLTQRLALTLLLLSSTLLSSCTKEVVPAAPKVTCPLPDAPGELVISAISKDGMVELTPTDAAAIGLKLRQECQWRQMASACLGLQPVTCPS